MQRLSLGLCLLCSQQQRSCVRLVPLMKSEPRREKARLRPSEHAVRSLKPAGRPGGIPLPHSMGLGAATAVTA